MSFLIPERRSGGTEWFAVGADKGVSEDRATCLAPVFATFRHLFDYISTLPADFYRVDGEKRVAVATPELVRNIDAEIGFGVWLGQAVYGVASRGNTVGRVTSLSPQQLPTMIEWAGMWSGGENEPWWINGKGMPSSLVAHIPWIVPPGKRLGLSPIAHYAAVVKAGLSAQEYADVKRGGGIPPVVLKNTKKTITPETAASARARAVRAFAAGEPFVTGNDWDLSAMTIPPNHAQFIETLNLSANQIAAIYGIDPREIGGTSESSLTYTTDESRALNRAQNATPYVVRLETAVNRWLPDGIVMKLNMNARIRADIKTQTDVVGAKLKDGRLSVDEARALDDRGPVPGGDFYNVPTPIQAEPTQR